MCVCLLWTKQSKHRAHSKFCCIFHAQSLSYVIVYGQEVVTFWKEKSRRRVSNLVWKLWLSVQIKPVQLTQDDHPAGTLKISPIMDGLCRVLVRLKSCSKNSVDSLLAQYCPVYVTLFSCATMAFCARQQPLSLKLKLPETRSQFGDSQHYEHAADGCSQEFFCAWESS